MIEAKCLAGRAADNRYMLAIGGATDKMKGVFDGFEGHIRSFVFSISSRNQDLQGM